MARKRRPPPAHSPLAALHRSSVVGRRSPVRPMTDDRRPTTPLKITAFVSHHDCSRHDTGWQHPEHQGRLPAIARAVYRDMLTLFDPLLEVEGVPATIEELHLAHAPDYVARIAEGAHEAERAGHPLPLDGVMLSGASWAAATAAAGCAVTAVDTVLRADARNAFCAVRPPGHGAGVASAGLHGIFNSVALAARHLRERRAVARVLVVEWGARGGSGTAEILGPDPAVRFLSLHQADRAGPAELWSTAAAVPLPPGAGGPLVLELLRAALDRVTRDFHPEFILLSLGCDALADDPTSDLALAPPDYHTLTAELLARADQLCGGRLVSVLEEGYDTAGMGAAVVQHLRALAGLAPA